MWQRRGCVCGILPLQGVEGMLITLSQGSGGRAGNQLIEEEIVSRFGNGPLAGLPDGAQLPGGLVFSTDSFVVTPRFFPESPFRDRQFPR